MKRTANILLIIITGCFSAQAQNYGYFGRHNVLSAGIQTAWGSRVLNQREIRWTASYERTLNSRLSLVAEMQGQNRSAHNMSIATNQTLYLAVGNNDYMIENVQYNMVLRSMACVLGLKFFLREKGAIAPMGAYFSVYNDLTFNRVSDASMTGALAEGSGFTFRNFEFPHIAPFNITTQFINLGFGHSRIYADRVISDFSFGMSASFYNSGPYRFHPLRNETGKITYNPTDMLKYEISQASILSRRLWIKYKIGFIF